MKSVLLETSEQSRWQMLIMRACVCVCARVCPFDAAMSLLQSCSGAAPQANLRQTSRVTVTFKNNLPLSRKIDNIFVTFSVSLVPALCKPLCSYLRTGKDKDIYVPTYPSISIFLSLTHSYCYVVRKSVHVRTGFGSASLTLARTPLLDLSATIALLPPL